MRPAWPWQEEDLRVTRAGLSVIIVPWWQHARMWTIVLWLALTLLLAGGGLVAQQSLYHQTLSSISQWIVQESHRESACLHAARTDAARRICATQAALRVTTAQRQFNQQGVAWGGENAASQMNDAFNALAAATCVDSASGSVDMACLAGSAPRLWLMAQTDARAARAG